MARPSLVNGNNKDPRRTSAFDFTVDWVGDDRETTLDDTCFSMDLASQFTEEKAAKLLKIITKIMTIWTIVGWPSARREQRFKELDEFVEACFKEMEESEDTYLQNLSLERTRFLEEVQKILADLHEPPYEPDEKMTLFQVVKCLKNKHSELEGVKKERMDKLNDLKKRMSTYCKLLEIQEPPVNLQTDIPSGEEIMNLQTAVSDLEKERKKRHEMLKCLRDMISELMGQLEWTPRDDFEKHVLIDHPAHKPLSEDYLKKMQVFHKDLKDHYAKNQKEFELLDSKLKALHNRLDIPEYEQEEFRSTHYDCKPSILSEMKKEIEKYEEMKKQNIGIFIEKIRAELCMEYNKCFLQEHPEFTLSKDQIEFTEELLELHERELERVRTYYEVNKPILEKFQKWQEMWHKFKAFEFRHTDANRYNNRGGQLEKELKEQKQINKGLPRVEAELKDLCSKFEAQNPGRNFRIFDSDRDRDFELSEFIQCCWADYAAAKESEKRERLKTKNISSNQKVKKPPTLQQSTIAARRTPVKRMADRMITPTPTKMQCRGTGTPSSSHNSRNLFRGIDSSSKKGLAPSVNVTKNGLPNTFINSSLSLNEEEFENAIQSCHTSGRRY